VITPKLNGTTILIERLERLEGLVGLEGLVERECGVID
jgi:hypothetical protein